MRKYIVASAMMLVAAGLTAGPANTNIAVWLKNSSGTPITYIEQGGKIVAPAIGADLAGNGASITNISAANLKAATVATAIDGSAITNIASAGVASLSATKLIAGSVATAIDGSAVTNLNATSIASGNLGAARMPTIFVASTNFAILIPDGSGGFKTNEIQFAYGGYTNQAAK